MVEVKAECAPEDLERTVMADIGSFDTWFRSLGNEALVRPEIAILKTYLHWKIKGGQYATPSR